MLLNNNDVLSDRKQPGKKFGKLVFAVVLISACIFLGLLTFITNSKNKSLQNQIAKLEEKRRMLVSSLSKVSSFYPIIIEDLTFQNGSDNRFSFGTEFRSSESKYIYPIISFKKVEATANSKIELKIRLLDQSGNLLHNAQHSPKNFTMSADIELTDNVPIANYRYPPLPSYTTTLSGWGSKTSPSYSIGDYKVQIWFENKCLYEGGFKII